MTPKLQWTNANGSVVKVFETDEPFKFRVTINDKPFDPNRMVDNSKGKR